MRERQRFEKWVAARGGDIQIYGDGNYSDETTDLWAAWAAAQMDSYGEKALNILAKLCAIVQATGEVTIHNKTAFMDEMLSLILDEQEDSQKG